MKSNFVYSTDERIAKILVDAIEVDDDYGSTASRKAISVFAIPSARSKKYFTKSLKAVK